MGDFLPFVSVGVNLKMCKTITRNTLKSTWNEKNVRIGKAVTNVSENTLMGVTLCVPYDTILKCTVYFSIYGACISVTPSPPLLIA